MTEICSIIHKCTIHGEKNYMNLDFSSPLRTAIKKKFNGDVVLGSRLVLLHHHDDCKWICHLPCLQPTSASPSSFVVS